MGKSLLFAKAAVFLGAGLLAGACGAAAEGGPTRPNILFALADDWGYGHAGAYGCAWVKTPAFDRVAREGVLFTHAYTPTAKCAPSRASILTGRNPWQLKAAANHWCYFPSEFKTYAEALEEHGYFVGRTLKGWAPGVAKDASGKDRHMAGRPFNRRKLTPPTKGISDNDYAANFADFLDAAPTGQPWCFWYGCVEPHRGYEYGSGVAKGGKKLEDVPRVPGYWPDNEVVRNDMLDYAFEVEHFDAHLGRMLAALERRGLLDNTLVVVTGDNGMPFPHSKGQTYRDSNHLPLAVMWKGAVKVPGRTVDDYVSFIDLAPTFLEAAGLAWEQAGMAPPQGRSLTEILFSGKAGRVVPARDHVILGRERNDIGRPHDGGYPVRGIVKEDTLYLHNFEPSRWPACNPETGYLDTDGSPTKTEVLKARVTPAAKKFWDACFGKRGTDELYDLRSDPDCLDNLAGKRDAALLRRHLFDALKAQGDPRVAGDGKIFDAYPHANEKMRGYYEKRSRGQKLPADWVNESDFEPVEPTK
ncbi:MAG TPA: sulfatase [Kiritimatiellia bacterium]|nr:sulfatase [Kiritimatiellia bacterium]HPS07764.1 sulfatase [Kiritimatiellia bacterium]